MKISLPLFKSLAALSIGTLGLCMSEFGMMGVMPDIARSLAVTIPEAGNYVSAYALGVCAGAPILAIFARAMPLRSIVIFLMAWFAAGNTLTAFANDDLFMLLARFVAGLPHGGYFGVASIIAARMAGPAYAVMGVAIVMFGATCANLLGVPFATFIAWLASWRVAYGLVALIGLVTIFFIIKHVPSLPGMKDRGVAAEFRFLLKPAPWLIFIAIILGNGGMFCWYSYVSPYMTRVAGIPMAWMTAVMALAGFGMVCGNILSGRLSRSFAASPIAAGFQLVMGICLVLIFFLGSNAIWALVLMTFAAACLFGLSAPQQMLLLYASPGGQMLGAALAQVGFNLGNAFGAFTGGMIIGASSWFAGSALAGSMCAFGGFVLLLIYWRKFSDPLLKNKFIDKK